MHQNGVAGVQEDIVVHEDSEMQHGVLEDTGGMSSCSQELALEPLGKLAIDLGFIPDASLFGQE